MSVLRWFVCLFLGHVYTDWARITWVNWTYSWVAWVDPITTTNGVQESRFCLRCTSGYQQRWAAS